MGLFSNLFGKKEKEKMQEPVDEIQDMVSMYKTQDGRQVIDFYDAHGDFKQFYDSTRIVINQTPRIVTSDMRYYDCMVSWFGREDTEIYGVQSRKDIYEHVIVGIYPELMESDSEYLRIVMKDLLGQKRVQEHIERGFMSKEELEQKRQGLLNEARRRDGEEKKRLESEAAHCNPCGRYVGEIIKKDNTWRRKFDKNFGYAFHNLPEMEQKRQEHKMELERKRQERIAQRRAQIAELQSEIDEYEGQR